MTKSEFQNRLKAEILILDGAMGTILQPHLQVGACYDYASVTLPDVVREIHNKYVDAGADIINTNTFGGTRIKLDEFRLGDQVTAVNVRAAQIAREASGGRALVAGNIGPTGKLVEPMGDLTFDKAYAVFREQAAALLEGGVDLFNLETFSDLKEIKIAILAIKDLCDLPMMASMTFEESFLTFTGTNPETAANVLTSLGVDVLGVNCSTGPEPMLEVLGQYIVNTDRPVFVEPNAGIPRLEQKGATYQLSPEYIAEYAIKFVDLGANIVGSCCGSTPEYTVKIRNAIKNRKPLSRSVPQTLKLSSRLQTVSIGNGLPFCIIGERINPTNRDDLAEAIRNGKFSVLQKEAQSEISEGAHLLDVNIGVPGLEESLVMGKIVRSIENVIQVPLCVDSTHPAAIEAALKETSGKPLINSVHGSQESLNAVLPLAAKYGAGLLCLAVGEKGIPITVEERIEVLKKIIAEAETAGIPRSHLICDCLTLTVSAQQKRADATLRAIRIVREDLGLPNVLGISNISFGLPERSLMNATFLSMAMAAGLDAAIMNPGDSRMTETVRAASVLTVRDKDSKAFVTGHQKKKSAGSLKPEIQTEENRKIYNAVIAGNRDEISGLVEDALKNSATALEINNTMLIPAIQEVGRRYDQKEIFLPQMILAAETMQKAFTVLEPHFASGDVQSKGKVLLCTVRGDVHDIGKNIVALFLKNQGYEVVDLGKDVSVDEIIDQVRDLSPNVVGLSALMTTTMVEMPKLIACVKKHALPVKVIVGGAVVTQRYATEIGADGYAKDGMTAVDLVNALVQS